MNWTVHHRKEKSRGGDNSQRNTALVPQSRHVAWHILKGTMPLEKLCFYINTFLIDPDYEIQLVQKHPPVSPDQLDLPLGHS